MSKLKIKSKYYGQATAPVLRIVGDFLNYLSASAALYSVINNDQTLTILFIVIGAAGKAITGAFTTEDSGQDENN